MRGARDRALLLGLAALRETIEQARERPAARTLQLRALLALIHAASGGDADHCRALWAACVEDFGVRDGSEAEKARAHAARGAAAHRAWTRLAHGCGFNPETIGFNETIERLMLQARHGEAARRVRAAARQKPKMRKDCGWL